MTATRLTEAQEGALRLVGEGRVVRTMGKWYVRGDWLARRPQPYERLLRLGLIAIGPRNGLDNTIVLTDAGRGEQP